MTSQLSSLASSAAVLPPPTRRWSVEGFSRFWESPNPQLVGDVIWPEIEGHWPRARRPLVGRVAYVQGIADLLAAIPGFRAEVVDSALVEDGAFVRWKATGKTPVGPETLIGVDRLFLKDGFVVANHIHSDHPVFALLAEKGILG